jgi:hypothetical protein
MLSRRVFATALVLGIATASLARAQDPDGLPPPAKTSAAALPATIETGFDPAKDGAPFNNIGSYASQGDCVGMSLVAIDHFRRRKAGETMPAQDPPDDSNTVKAALVGDPVEHEVAAIVQALGDHDDAVFDHAKTAKLSDPRLVRDALLRIENPGEPEVLGIDGRGDDGHALVLFGFKDGKLQIYDPNYPGETVQWPFDPVKGLSKYPKAFGTDPKEADMRKFYSGMTRVTPVPFGQFKVSQEIAKIRDECSTQAKACTAKFPVVTAEVKPSADGQSVTISGTVSRGEKKSEDGPTTPPGIVLLRVNGQLQKTPTAIKNGRFSVTLPASALKSEGDNVVQVVASTREGGFAGYATTKPFQLGPRKGVTEALTSPSGSGSPAEARRSPP